jgi:DNA-binding NtrC family response regulator
VIILVIDDDSTFRTEFSARLRQDGHFVHEYMRPAELPSLDTLGEVSLVIIDHALPEQNGLALADTLRKVCPRTPIVLLTWYWSLQLASEVAARPFVHLCRKPIGYDELCALVRCLGMQAASSRL